MTKLVDDTGAPLPLVVPCKADAKTYDHRIYVNYAGAKLLQELLERLLKGETEPEGVVWQNGEEVKLKLRTSRQEDFDCGGPVSLRESVYGIGTYRKIMPPIPISAEEAKNLPPLDNGQPIKVLDPPVQDSLVDRVSEALQPPETP